MLHQITKLRCHCNGQAEASEITMEFRMLVSEFKTCERRSKSTKLGRSKGTCAHGSMLKS